jgi:hypothetical protein
LTGYLDGEDENMALEGGNTKNLGDFLSKKAEQIRMQNFKKHQLKAAKIDYAEQKAIEALMENSEVNHPPPVISLRSEYEIGEKLG